MGHLSDEQMKLWKALPIQDTMGDKSITYPWINVAANERLWEKFWMQEYAHCGGANTLDHILDFGCGVGLGWLVANSRGFKNVIPLDIVSERMQKVFAPFVNILNPPIVYWEGAVLPFESDHFDSVVAKASIMKCVNSDFETVIKELIRVTKYRGTWFIAPKLHYSRLWAKMSTTKLFDLSDAKRIEIKYWQFDDGTTHNV